MRVVVLSGRCNYLHICSTVTPMLQKPDKTTTCVLVARTVVENIVAQWPDVHSREITIIFNQPKLKAENLSKFRSVLEIMGY